jgi:outer membrane protein OmpA-like peptidoglycan-associated protein
MVSASTRDRHFSALLGSLIPAEMPVAGKWTRDKVRVSLFASLLAGATVLAGATASWAEAGCEQLLDPFNAALTKADLSATIAAAKPILGSAECPAETRREVGVKVALAHVREADQTQDPASQLTILESGMAYAQPWKMMKLIGDLRRKVPASNGSIDYAAASLAYQSALADIADKKSVLNPPPNEVIQELMELANESRMLSSTFVRGDVLLTRSLRDVAVETVPVPVQFVRDRNEMTPLGEQYAAEMARLLGDQGHPRVLLVGHTDPDGSDQYNLTLSLRRAQAVRRYLIEHGYPAANVDAEGHGRREPLALANEADYSQAQIYQMLRRVEVKYH